MYISFVTICILIAIVVFCWFRKPAKTVAQSAAELIEVGADITHAGLTQIRDAVEVSAMTSHIKNTAEILALMQENKEMLTKGITVHSLYCGYQATINTTTVGEKGRSLTPQQENALLRASFMETLNSLSPAPASTPEAQPAVQATQPVQADPDAEVFKL